MDVLLSIATGLGLRLFLVNLDQSLDRLVPAFLGLWEGIIIHLSNSNLYSPTPDHYLAYALRLVVDLYLTSDLRRTFVVVVWTVLGLIVSETVDPSRPQRDRRRRSSRPLPARIHSYELPASPQPHEQFHVPATFQVDTPTVHSSRPPTPPSSFLGKELNSSSSQSQPLDALVYPEHNHSPVSPEPKLVLLPTPPTTTIFEGHEAQSDHRLSTIEEHSSAEDSEASRPGYSGVQGPVLLTSSHGPSGATTPVPIPILNRYGFATSRTRTPVGDSDTEAENNHTPLPVPVPNLSSVYYRPSQDDDSEDDPLQTPPPVNAPWKVASNDPLSTPLASQLSPLELERPIIPSFSTILESQARLTPQLSFNDTWPTAAQQTSVGKMVTAEDAHLSGSPVQAARPSAVEYLSSHVVGDLLISSAPITAPKDSEHEQQTPGSQPKHSDSIEHDQRQHDQHDLERQLEDPPQERNHSGDSNNNGSDNKFAETETEAETETDATSVISNHPAAAMYVRAEKLRAQAWAAEQEKQRLETLLQTATKNARVKDILFLLEDIRLEEEKAAKLHEKAARRFIQARNTTRSLNSPTIDVHGLRVTEAVRTTEKKLREAFTNGHTSVRVIVGKGLHSTNSVPVLKNAVTRNMSRYKIPCRIDPRNAGVLILTLPTT